MNMAWETLGQFGVAVFVIGVVGSLAAYYIKLRVPVLNEKDQAVNTLIQEMPQITKSLDDLNRATEGVVVLTDSIQKKTDQLEETHRRQCGEILEECRAIKSRVS